MKIYLYDTQKRFQDTTNNRPYTFCLWKHTDEKVKDFVATNTAFRLGGKGNHWYESYGGFFPERVDNQTKLRGYVVIVWRKLFQKKRQFDMNFSVTV